MFTRLLVGLDGSARADAALEQALLLGARFHSSLIVAHVREGPAANRTRFLTEAHRRAAAAGLDVHVVEQEGEPDTALAELAKTVDAALVGRRGVASPTDALGATVTSLIRVAEGSVIVCGGTPSPMQSCAVVFDGQDTSRRALDLAARFASVAESTVHVINVSEDPAEGVQVVGVAEAVLSLQRVAFATHVETGRPGRVIPAVLQRIGCDALFVGAHLARIRGRTSAALASHAEEILLGTDIPVVIQP